mmetsp:Transcript_8031/g.27808  ORF Transcript_8031/g.27808 Transcript_8031/m.27808 type:complete len:309 (+) Transcript_8031:366-1292(+)
MRRGRGRAPCPRRRDLASRRQSRRSSLRRFPRAASRRSRRVGTAPSSVALYKIRARVEQQPAFEHRRRELAVELAPAAVARAPVDAARVVSADDDVEAASGGYLDADARQISAKAQRRVVRVVLTAEKDDGATDGGGGDVGGDVHVGRQYFGAEPQQRARVARFPRSAADEADEVSVVLCSRVEAGDEQAADDGKVPLAPLHGAGDAPGSQQTVGGCDANIELRGPQISGGCRATRAAEAERAEPRPRHPAAAAPMHPADKRACARPSNGSPSRPRRNRRGAASRLGPTRPDQNKLAAPAAPGRPDHH